MASAESIDRLLTLAAAMLDHAAGEIRDAPLEPVRANILQIGKALAEIFELQGTLHEAHPDLRPAFLTEPSPHPEANRLLTVAMSSASYHEEAGRLELAIAAYREFLGHETTPLHRDIAQAELERLQRPCDD